MSPKFYGFLWVLFGGSAGLLWLAGVFTMLTVVVFGFVAFGLTFVGMMCVLPGAVGHSHETRLKASLQVGLCRVVVMAFAQAYNFYLSGR